jgi:mannose-6-phosphate isomerase-like protein (cupin superfamily)
VSDVPDTRSLDDAIVVTAPDGSAVRPLCQLPGRASFAHFQLEPGEIAKPVSHATVQEIWYVIGGSGRLWRRHDGRQETAPLRPGVCVTIPLGTTFQFRADDAAEPLQVVAVTVPPWPVGSEHEAKPEQGPWIPVLRR